MSTEKLIGSQFARIATIVAGCFALLGELLARSASGSAAGWGRMAAIGCAFLMLLGAIHSTRTGYELWMRFAKALSGVMTTLVFGICYLLLVPLFVPIVWLLDPLRLRRDEGAPSFWHRRPDIPVDWEMLRRMG